MGEQFFGIDIEATIANAMPSSSMPNFTLRVPSGTTYGATLIDGIEQTDPPDEYPCHGAIVKFDQTEFPDATEVTKSDVIVVLIAKPLNDVGVKPKKNDTLVDSSGTIYQVVGVKGDGFSASFKLHCR